MEADGKKKDHGQGSVDMIVIQGDLSTGENLTSTRTQTEDSRSLNSLLIPGLFHIQVALHSMM